MTTLLGDLSPAPQHLDRSARITFCTRDLQLKWSHCSSSADFLSQYYAGVLAPNRSTTTLNDITHSIAYLANELIENAVKFRTDGEVSIEAGLSDGEFVLRIANWVAPETSERF